MKKIVVALLLVLSVFAAGCEKKTEESRIMPSPLKEETKTAIELMTMAGNHHRVYDYDLKYEANFLRIRCYELRSGGEKSVIHESILQIPEKKGKLYLRYGENLAKEFSSKLVSGEESVEQSEPEMKVAEEKILGKPRVSQGWDHARTLTAGQETPIEVELFSDAQASVEFYDLYSYFLTDAKDLGQNTLYGLTVEFYQEDAIDASADSGAMEK